MSRERSDIPAGNAYSDLSGVVPPPAADLPRRYVILALLVILTLASLILSWAYFPNYGAGVDEASYLLAAQGIALRGDPAYRNPDPTVFVPENMVETRPGVFYPKYPIGYPILCAAAYSLASIVGASQAHVPEAPFLVNPLLTLVALLAFFFLARQFLGELFALTAALLLALSPVTMYYGVTALSHASDLAFSTACLYFAWSWYQRPRAGPAVLAGLCFGYVLTIRYTEALLALPLLFLAVTRLRNPAPAPRREILLHLLLASSAMIPGLALLITYHLHAFGSPFITGYSLTGESTAFSFAWFRDHFLLALRTLSSLANGISILFPLALIALPWLILKQRVAGIFLALAILPTLLLYIAYYWANAANPLLYARFFYTLFPPLIIAALLPVHHLLRNRPVPRYISAGLLVVLASLTLAQAPPLSQFQGTAYVDRGAVDLVRRSLPGDTVILAYRFSGYSLIYYNDMTICYPHYYNVEWVHDRLLAPPEKKGIPTDFNPLRTARFDAALGHRSQEELVAILRQRLLFYAHEGRPLAMLVSTDFPVWWPPYLGDDFRIEPLAADDQHHLVLYRLIPTR